MTSQAPVRKELFRLPEAAEYLGVTKQTIYNWINSGKIEAVRIGDKLLRIPYRCLQDIQKSLD
jgi:excisionase family DNA binding protein